MSTKIKTKSNRAFLFLTASFFLTAFFVWKNFASGSGQNVVISEIMHDPESGNVEWLELLATSDLAFELKNGSGGPNQIKDFYICTKGTEAICVSSYAVYSPDNTNQIKKDELFVITKDIESFKKVYESFDGVILRASSSFNLLENSDASISISFDNKKTWQAYQHYADFLSIAKNEYSLNYISIDTNDENINDWKVSCEKGGTPGKENVYPCEIEEKPEPVEQKIYPSGIMITELFPNPFQSQYAEYIELYNGTDENIDLEGWMLRDASKTGKYVFGESLILKSKKYLAIFKEKFKFALNNSGNESVTLFDSNGKEVSKAQYNGSKINISFNLDGLRWRGSKFLTPGAENILNNEPFGKVKIDKDVFENVYADFSVSTGDGDGETVKVTWDFGDGHKSYLAKTRHKYEKTGTYLGNVKLSDGSEDVIEKFEIEVEKFPHPEVRIVAINANPEGVDAGEEFLTVKNKSNKRINLEGWSIATGWKDFINHPIREDVIIKKDKSKNLTNEVASFTLNNTKAKIQLRYPDGETAHEVKYKKKDGIKDGEIYKKVKGGWAWILNPKSITHNVEPKIQGQEPMIKSIESETVVDGEIAGMETEKIKNTFVMLENNIVIGKIKISDDELRTMGIESMREVDGQYILTVPGKDPEHYAIKFLKNIALVFNEKLNWLLYSF